MLISVITHNLEVSFHLTEKEEKQLSDVDMQLLCGSLFLGSKSSQCLILLELGLPSVSFILKKKRVLYLHHLLTTDQSSLVCQVFQEQVRKSRRHDWVQTVRKDLEHLEINLSFSQIASMGKKVFKQLVKESCEIACFKSLIREKEKLSKGSEITYTDFKSQPYLMSDSELSVEMMRKIYHIRTRELPVKANFPPAFEYKLCRFPHCFNENNQKHIFDSVCFSAGRQYQIIDKNITYADQA